MFVLACLCWFADHSRQATNFDYEMQQKRDTIMKQDFELIMLHKAVNMPCVPTHNDSLVIREMECTLGKMKTFDNKINQRKLTKK